MLSLRRSMLRRYRLYAPHMFRRGWLLLVILLLCDGVTALCFPQIQAAIAWSPAAGGQSISLANQSAALTLSQTVLASDTFQRPDRTGWGTTVNGQGWQAEAKSGSNFHIINNVGTIDALQSATPQDAILGPVSQNAEVTFTGSLSHYDKGNNALTLGALLRWSNTDNFYEVYLNGQDLCLIRVMDGMPTFLTMVPAPAPDGAVYTFRFRAVGSQLSAMVWPSDQPAPNNWQISASDSALSSGQAGIRVLAQNNVQAKITAFTEVAL